MKVAAYGSTFKVDYLKLIFLIFFNRGFNDLWLLVMFSPFFALAFYASVYSFLLVVLHLSKTSKPESKILLRRQFKQCYLILLQYAYLCYCLLFVVYCLLFVVCCLLFVVCCLLFVVCCLLFIVYCLFIVCLFIVYLLFIVML